MDMLPDPEERREGGAVVTRNKSNLITVIPGSFRRESTIHENQVNKMRCEVIGSATCKYCLEVKVKQGYSLSRPMFPTIHHTAKSIGADVAAVINIQKSYPAASTAQLQQKLNCGTITPYTFGMQRQRWRQLQSKAADSRTQAITVERGDNQTKKLFFSDMSDLRLKIQAGIIPKTQSGKKYEPTVTDRLFPSFVSPKAVNKQLIRMDEPVSLFAPPLFPIECQNPNTEFYAGQPPHCPPPTPLRINPDYDKAIQEVSFYNSQVTGENTDITTMSMSMGESHSEDVGLYNEDAADEQ